VNRQRRRRRAKLADFGNSVQLVRAANVTTIGSSATPTITIGRINHGKSLIFQNAVKRIYGEPAEISEIRNEHETVPAAFVPLDPGVRYVDLNLFSGGGGSAIKLTNIIERHNIGHVNTGLGLIAEHEADIAETKNRQIAANETNENRFGSSDAYAGQMVRAAVSPTETCYCVGIVQTVDMTHQTGVLVGEVEITMPMAKIAFPTVDGNGIEMHWLSPSIIAAATSEEIDALMTSGRRHQTLS
jgi:hypothetical protein